MMQNSEIPLDILQKIVSLDPATGDLFWLPRTPDLFQDAGQNSAISLCDGWNKRWSGKRTCDQIDRKGYLRGHILSRKFRAHRVVFALHYGFWPINAVDHINGVRADNRPENLREADAGENARNAKRRVTNTTGVCGVCLNKKDGLFWATIRVGKKQVLLGRFEQLADAAEARATALKEHGYHPNHGRVA